jgi:Type I phosphodiesterase / nucleotide pyrophosphatase
LRRKAPGPILAAIPPMPRTFTLARCLTLALLVLSAAALARPPRLTLFITIDSLGTDLLLRNRSHFHAGLATLLDKGAFFPDARYEQAEVMTAPGHSVLSTGAYPWRTGIVSNRVLNRATGKEEPIFWDAGHPVLGAPAGPEDSSPESLLAETLSDHLRLFTSGRGKVVVLSGKARAAIPLAGRLGEPFWFNDAVGRLVTGTFYAKELPAWVKALNDRRVADQAFGLTWTLSLPEKAYSGQDDRPFEADALGMKRKFPHQLSAGLPAPGPPSYEAFASSPYFDDFLVEAAKSALSAEQLGKDDVPDMLAVSFSALDRIYHRFGPYSWEVQDALVRLDRSLGDLLAAAERAAGGRANLLVVLSSDHGGAAIPEELISAGLPGLRVKPTTLKAGLQAELTHAFGAPLLLAFADYEVVLDEKALETRHLEGAVVRRAAAAWLARQPGVALAVARDDLGSCDELQGYRGALQRSYFAGRSGDVLFLLRPLAVLDEGDEGTNHGLPYAYDAQVPVVLYGRGVRPGTYTQRIHAVDVAPTIATLLEMGGLAGAEGVPRSEAISLVR